MKKLFFNARLVDKNIDSKGAVLINNDCIEEVFTNEEDFLLQNILADSEIETIDIEGKVLMPSFIDLHTHLRNPGQSQKETVESFLDSAVAGGFGLVVAMPNTNPIISSMELAKAVQDECKNYKKCEVIQSISITKDFAGTDISHLEALEGFPLVTEDGRDVANSDIMLEVMKVCGKKKIVVSCHCEDETYTNYAKPLRSKSVNLLNEIPAKDWATLDKSKNDVDVALVDDYFAQANEFLRTAEDVATMRNIELAVKAQCHVHIAHASTIKTMELIKNAKEKGAQVTCEVTPHHFGLSSDNEGFLRYIVNPPIRTSIDRNSLLNAIKEGIVDCIATDHAPHTMHDKQSGSPGFSGLETSFAVSYTELVKSGLISLSNLSALMSANPAKIINKQNIGLLKKGYCANIAIVDENEKWTADSKSFKTKGCICPFESKKLVGKVVQTYFKGNLV